MCYNTIGGVIYMKKLGYIFLLLLFSFTSIYSIYRIYDILSQNNVEKEHNEYLTEIAGISNKNTEEEISTTREIDFEALKATNNEIIGWLTIPDTTIDYAIVQGADNDYYLHHNALKEANYAGAVFVDYRNQTPFQEPHTIVYAHNVKHGTMFAPLEKYMDEAFFQNHPVYYIYTPDANYEVEVFAFYTTIATSDAYELYQINEYVPKWQLDSMHQSDVVINEEDCIVTLSTCSYERNNQPSELRHVLKGILRKQKE